MSPLFLRPVALGTAAFTLALAGCTTTTDSFLSSRVVPAETGCNIAAACEMAAAGRKHRGSAPADSPSV